MKLRHPVSGAIYTKRADGQVEVEEEGKIGFFQTDGQYVRGDVHFADPHMLNWLEGEGALPNRRWLPQRRTLLDRLERDLHCRCAAPEFGHNPRFFGRTSFLTIRVAVKALESFR